MRTTTTPLFLTLLIAASLLCVPAKAQEQAQPPVIPTGLDAYRMWDQWPVQRIGARAYMRSTYDRTGGNESADASHFLFMKEDEAHNVTLDIAGKGVLYFVRTNHWHGSPWRYIVDGQTNLIRETATADPVDAKKKFETTTFIPEEAFPEPLTYTWSTTKGADLMWVPIGFEKSFQLAYGRTRYGTGYYIWHHYANDDYFSSPITAWDMGQRPDGDVVDLLRRSGTDIAPENIEKKEGSIRLNGDRTLLADIRSAPSAIRALKIRVPLEQAEELERLRLQVTWDGRPEPSIDAPLCLFFGAGTLFNRDKREYLVKGFPINIRFDYQKGEVELACYYPMPFFKSARIELVNETSVNADIEFEVRYEPYELSANQSGYFHATYRDIPEPVVGEDLTLLDTRGVEGAKEWSGNFVGTSFIFSHDNYLGTLEGDPRFFFDDSQTPQAYGTGTEEWGGGGDYWGGRNMTLPFAGHPCGARRKEDAMNEKDMIQSAYRFLLADLMPFGNRAVIRLEHGGQNLSTEHYETVTYWYGIPAPSLVRTDELDVGDRRSEKKHDYRSPDASDVYDLTSRYEWGIDSLPKKPWGRVDTSSVPGYTAGKEVYPAHTQDGRFTRGSSEFTVRLDKRNLGALLRRTLDYSYPNQRAEVSVAAEGEENWQHVGTWYLAGSNTCVYSDPRGELDKRLYNAQTSNRRFRDDEFLIPAKFTAGLERIRVRVEFVPVDQELYPGKPFPKDGAWSELGYQAYSFVMPDYEVR